MMHEDYIKLKRQVGETGSGSTSVSWPHPVDFQVAPGENVVQELYGLHYVSTLSHLAKVMDGFYMAEQDGVDVAGVADHLVSGLIEVLGRAKKFQEFAHQRNICLSAGPGCTCCP